MDPFNRTGLGGIEVRYKARIQEEFVGAREKFANLISDQVVRLEAREASECERLNAEIVELKAEIERLKSENERLRAVPPGTTQAASSPPPAATQSPPPPPTLRAEPPAHYQRRADEPWRDNVIGYDRGGVARRAFPPLWARPGSARALRHRWLWQCPQVPAVLPQRVSCSPLRRVQPVVMRSETTPAAGRASRFSARPAPFS